MSPTPKTKSSQLLDDAREKYHSGTRNDFELRQLLKRSEVEIQRDPHDANANCANFIVLSMMKRSADTVASVRTALSRVIGDDHRYYVFKNGLKALMNVAAFDEHFRVVDEIWSKFPDSKELAKEVAGHAFLTGRFGLALEADARLRKLSPEEGLPFASGLVKLNDFLFQKGIAESQVIPVAESFLEAIGKYTDRISESSVVVSPWLVDPDGGSYSEMLFLPDISSAQCVDVLCDAFDILEAKGADSVPLELLTFDIRNVIKKKTNAVPA